MNPLAGNMKKEDTVMAYHTEGTEAYDLSLFEPKEPKLVELKPNKKLQKVQSRRTKLQTFLNTAMTLSAAVVAVVIMGSMITTRVQLTELNNVINQKQAELEDMQAEYKQLNAALAAKMSAQSVDAYAQENGMQKTEPGQIEYITVDGGDKVEVPEETVGWWEKLCGWVTNFFSDLAYLFQ